MVKRRGTDEAVRLRPGAPALSLGLHVNFTNEAERLVEFDDPRAGAATSCGGSSTASWQLDGPAARPTSTRTSTSIARAALPAESSGSWPKSTACRCGTSRRSSSRAASTAQWEYGVSDPRR